MDETNKLIERWEPLLEGITDENTRGVVAVLCENQARNIVTERSKAGMLEETTYVGNLGTFQKFAFPLIRRVFPELIANKCVGVQPMAGPVGQIFYLGYDRRANADATPQNVYSQFNLTYRGLVASGNGNYGGIDGAATNGAGSFDYSALMGSGVTPASGTVGGQIASFPSSTTLTQFVVSAGERMGTTGNPDIPELTFNIQQQAVITSTRKFRALWTIEATQDLRAYHSIDLERELTDLLGKEMALEIDRELIEDLRMIAYDATDISGFNRSNLMLGNTNNFGQWVGNGGNFSPGSWTYDQAGLATNPSGTYENVFFVDFATTALGMAPRHVGEVYSNLLAAVNFVSQDIYKTTWRGGATFIITSPFVAAILQSAAKLEGGIATNEAGQLGANIVYKGKWLGQYDVYVDPLYPDDEMLLGYKGASNFDAGYFYAPYIPMQLLPTIHDPNSFQPRKGIMTRYGKACVAPESRFYRIIRLVGASSNYLLTPFVKIDNAPYSS